MSSPLRLWCGVLVVLGCCLSAPLRAGEKDAPLPAAQAIRVEACRANDDPLGWPLPLASHWNTGTYPPKDTFDPAYQLGLIAKGHHVLPFLSMPSPADSAERKAFNDYYETAFKKASELKLPLSLIASQWESLLTYDKAYPQTAARQKIPNVIGLDGKVRKEVDPMGPVGPWREVGRSWTTSPGMKLLQRSGIRSRHSSSSSPTTSTRSCGGRRRRSRSAISTSTARARATTSSARWSPTAGSSAFARCRQACARG